MLRPDVTLRAIDEGNVNETMKLKTTEAQQRFVAPVPYSLGEAAYAPGAWARAIAADDRLVGFVMLHLGEDRYVYLWRFLIDHRYQRTGIGSAAIAAVIDQVRAWGAPQLRLSYVPGEGSPAAFYEKAGFVETGEVDGGERVMVMDLTPAASAVPDASDPSKPDGADSDGASDAADALAAPDRPKHTERAEVAKRYRTAAFALDRAAGHARIAARHMADGEVPRACAHALAARGDVLDATDTLDALARLHAAKAR